MKGGLDELVLRDIARHSHASVEDVKKTYDEIVAGLRTEARVHDFIPLLAMKRVRQYFLHRHPLSLAVQEAEDSRRQESPGRSRQRLAESLLSPCSLMVNSVARS